MNDLNNEWGSEIGRWLIEDVWKKYIWPIGWRITVWTVGWILAGILIKLGFMIFDMAVAGIIIRYLV